MEVCMGSYGLLAWAWYPCVLNCLRAVGPLSCACGCVPARCALPYGCADGSCGSGGLLGFLGGFWFSSKIKKLVNYALSGVGNQVVVTKWWRLNVVLYIPSEC